jgi:hypothetical protein
LSAATKGKVEILKSELIAIKASDGTYISTYPGTGDSARPQSGENGIIYSYHGAQYHKLEKLSNKKVAISNFVNRFYLSADKKSSIQRKDKELGLTNNQFFTYIKLRNNKFALRASNGKYVSLHSDRYLYADAKKINKSTIFKKIPIKTFIIKAANGKYLVSKDIRDLDSPIAAIGKSIESRAVVDFIKLNNNKVALNFPFAFKHNYTLTANPLDKNALLLRNVIEINKNTTFTYIKLRNNKFALKASTGYYVSAKKEKPIVANSSRIGKWETFSLIPYEKYE